MKIGENLHYLGLGTEFLDSTPKSQFINEKKKKNQKPINWTRPKFWNFCSVKDSCKENEKASYRVGENNCKPHIQQRCVIKKYKELSKLNSKKTSQFKNGWTLCQREYINNKQVHENLLNPISQ